ncbi:MAG: hypothetical protein JWO09_3813 [Bacteroidetes bacterium]|nr:hypothetical protein [Bacteroidota bacterium]
MIKKTYITLLLALSFLFAEAQQIGFYSHAFFKPMVYNPAFTGNAEGINAMIISRAQWTGFNGGPQLNLFTLDGSLPNNKTGLGLCLISDRKGITNRTGGNINYSYRLNITDAAYLRFGIAAGIIDQSIDFSKALVEDPSDPFTFGDQQRKTVFDANAGLAFFWKGLEAGVAVPQLIGNKIAYVDNTDVRATYTQVRHFLGTLKYSLPLSKDKGLYIAPQALVRYLPGAPFQYDGTLNLEWRDKAWIGATYKSDYAITAHLGFCIHKQLYVGYAYDIILGDLSRYSGISHEVMVSFKFGKNKKEEASAEKAVNTGEQTASEKRLDSLQAILEESQSQIRANAEKIKVLTDKLEQQSKAIQAQQQAASSSQASPVQGQGQPSQQQPQSTGAQNQNTNTPAANNQNQNAAAVETDKNKVNDNGIWLVTNNSKDFKTDRGGTPKKGYYVVAGTFVYLDFAEAEVKRLKAQGFPSTNRIFSEQKQFNYVFVSSSLSKDEAMKAAEKVRAGGIKDAWILQLVE